MKFKTIMVVVTVNSLMMTGCSFDNPFTKDSSESTEDQQQSQPEVDEKNSGDEQQSGEKPDQNNNDQEDGNDDEPSDEQADLPSLKKTVKVNADGKKVVTNVNDTLVLVNKTRNLPSDYIPESLVVPNVQFPFTEDLPKKKMQQVAAKALEKMFTKAEQDNIPLFAQSGYRSYDRQEAIFASNVQQHGEEEANKFSAHPGQSEHQTGLAMDVTSPAVEFFLVERFAETKAGKWVQQNAHEFGFIIRYPKGKEGITGYSYEPWHLRYVGKEHATKIHEQNMTLEEYLGVQVEQVNASQ
ncbi:D-alanyl-D-alanine carboxypeptidase family protein [Alkalihalobacillus sp. AL-G]|uniref:M15 family metallopeptidase n=1 Tax=Alkalihalobacillus sp. AL-G TaxID=2926399 RepID=UPI00272B5DE6|nr:M15 family metallopeptidase [Alkalihalobacillus sp. AL-G]WLD95258.1 M15 family metallopeptidase [Alkalihalobacillus sp. AL-G]